MESKPTITEMNSDIALFMEAEINPFYVDEETFRFAKEKPTPDSAYNWTARQMQYHERYDWLFPVWQKFRDVKIPLSKTEDHFTHERKVKSISEAILNKPITEAHRLIWDGVKWLETIKTKK